MSLKYKIGYVVGSYRANSIVEIKHNIFKAEKVASVIWKAGYPCICPHKNSSLMDGTIKDSGWLEGYLTILLKCDFVVCVEGYKKSEGSLDELSFCAKHKIPIFYSIEDFLTCLEDSKKSGYSPIYTRQKILYEDQIEELITENEKMDSTCLSCKFYMECLKNVKSFSIQCPKYKGSSKEATEEENRPNCLICQHNLKCIDSKKRNNISCLEYKRIEVN